MATGLDSFLCDMVDFYLRIRGPMHEMHVLGEKGVPQPRRGEGTGPGTPPGQDWGEGGTWEGVRVCQA